VEQALHLESDYVIVGAGSAGCVLASRLTEDPNVKVALVEAGGWDRNPWLRIPLAAADAYLCPALRRQNLTVMVNTLVHGVSFDGDCATSISCPHRGKTLRLRADREVLIAAGAINSPQLLLLSGIGDPAQLKHHNITVRVPLAVVGKFAGRDSYSSSEDSRSEGHKRDQRDP